MEGPNKNGFGESIKKAAKIAAVGGALMAHAPAAEAGATKTPHLKPVHESSTTIKPRSIEAPKKVPVATPNQVVKTEFQVVDQIIKQNRLTDKFYGLPESDNIEDRRDEALMSKVWAFLGFPTLQQVKEDFSHPFSPRKQAESTYAGPSPFDRDIENSVTRMREDNTKKVVLDEASRKGFDEYIQELENQTAQELDQKAEHNIWRQKK